ncbi:hypothetical protein BDZ94DRAFT_1252322 [Collybia nuda]|uniref:Uncharacterized protein n=1 Tax=Collybia nuda TaxID=64659 RepID=A0A9P6CMZ3_9AGAR|nr:hypothetical protein BDZ94DRAFT_1252322 [Collybia nuda]
MVLDIIPEQDEPIVDLLEEAEDEEDAQMNIHTVVFGLGPGGEVQAGYKYNPDLLRRLLFPSPTMKADRQPPRKRRRTEDGEGMDIDGDDATITMPLSEPRSVILETLKESYLLSPSALNTGDGVRAYDIALVLEGELEEEAVIIAPGPAEDVIPPTAAPPEMQDLPPTIEEPKGAETPVADSPAVPNPDVKAPNGDVVDQPKSLAAPKEAEIRNSPPPVSIPSPSDTKPQVPTSPTPQPAEATPLDGDITPTPGSPGPGIAKVSPTPEPSTPQPSSATAVIPPPPEIRSTSTRRLSMVSVLDFDDRSKPLLLQELQRHLGEEMFRFTDEGVKVTDGPNEEWTVQVKRWKWGPSTQAISI